MTCKHRWEPANMEYRTPNRYVYHCKRCHRVIFTTLKEKKDERDV